MHFGGVNCLPVNLLLSERPSSSEMLSLPMPAKDGGLSLGGKKFKRAATARFTGLYDG